MKIENSAFVANSCGVPKTILFAWYECALGIGIAHIVYLVFTEMLRFLSQRQSLNYQSYLHGLLTFADLCLIVKDLCH